MKILIVNTVYPEFLHWLYNLHPELVHQPYEEQIRIRIESLYGFSDFYSSNLRKLGYEAWDIYVNDYVMQKTWARERNLSLESDWVWRFRLRRKIVPWIDRVRNPRLIYETLATQIRYYKPDVLLNQAMNCITPAFLREMRPYVRFLIGQHAAIPLNEQADWSVYDLVISSFPPTLEWCCKRNIPAELLRLGFGLRVLDQLQYHDKTIPVSFIGSFFTVHSSRTALLEQLCEKVPLSVWGPAPNDRFKGSKLAKCYRGMAWGVNMYNILASSYMTVNHHGDVPPFANNMRLYEATGVGTLLVTDWKRNLHEIFELGKEVVAYQSTEECVELIRYHLENAQEREAIARAGQERTLREHTYYQRMQELVKLIRRYM